MENSFEDLIKKFGVPKIIIPNSPRLEMLKNGSILVSGQPEKETQPEDKIFYRRFKFGDSEFLAVRSRIEIYQDDEASLLEKLKELKQNPVEFIYRERVVRAWNFSDADWREELVSIATDVDVEPLSRKDLLEAIKENRLLWVCGWSSMGDKYVDFHICSTDILPKDQGLHFLFEKPCYLTEETLVGMGDDYEWEKEFFNDYKSYFTR